MIIEGEQVQGSSSTGLKGVRQRVLLEGQFLENGAEFPHLNECVNYRGS